MDDLQSQWHQEQVRKFNEKRGTFEQIAQLLESVLAKIKNRTDPTAIVQVRPKTLASFSEKALRKMNKYHDPVTQLTDLVGGRIITYTQAAAERVCRLIEELDDHGLRIDWDNTVNTGERLRPEEFGYKAMHYIVQLVPPRVLDVQVNSWIKSYTMEIQVCTMMQHVWSAIGHDRVYKTRLKIPDLLKRRLSAISALIETAQAEFETGILTLDRFIQQFPTGESEQEERMIWESVVRVEPHDRDARWRLAEHSSAKGQWMDAYDQFSQCDDTIPGILAKRGRAAARVGKQDEAEKLFIRAIEQDKTDWSARCDLAELFEQRGDHEEALSQYRETFAAVPSEPRVLTAYVAAMIRQQGQLSCTRALRGALDAAIDECRQRAELGVDVPNAYFQIGRCYLFQDNLYDALEAYCKAGLVCRSLDAFEAERSTVAEIFNKLNATGLDPDALEPYQCASGLLNLLSVVISRRMRKDAERAEEQRKQRPSHIKPLEPEQEAQRLTELATRREDAPTFAKQPVVIVAGGCDPKYETRLNKYRDTINEAFNYFEGTVICGGTKAGISGVIGDVSKKRGDAVEAIGYLPKGLPVGDERDDDNYSIYVVRTSGTRAYSPVGPIQTWADLLLAGVEPSTVRLLGINGGDLSGFEFRLAIAMGATVGLIEDSGRAVSGLLTDPDWKRLGRFAALLNEAETIAPFISAFCPMLQEIAQAERQEKLEALAQAQHEQFRHDKRASEGYVHPSMFPWDKDLAEAYKRSNRQQAAYADHILRTEGFAIVRAGDSRPAVDFNDEQHDKALWRMARLEHGRWNAERLAEGWRYGPERSLEKKTSPHLLPWQKLSPEIRTWDRDPFKKLPQLLAPLDLKIVQLAPQDVMPTQSLPL